MFWESEHSVNHHRLQIKRRVDRNLLCSLYEQGAQIDNICVGHFNLNTQIASQRDLEGSPAEKQSRGLHDTLYRRAIR